MKHGVGLELRIGTLTLLLRCVLTFRPSRLLRPLNRQPVTAAVPEPSTWAMMILGFFGVGYRRIVVAIRLLLPDGLPNPNAKAATG